MSTNHLFIPTVLLALTCNHVQAQDAASNDGTTSDKDALLGVESSSGVKSYLEKVEYEQILHSSSRGVEAGERAKIEAEFKVEPTKDTFFGVRVDTDPKKNSVENQTNKFELTMGSKLADFEIEVDLDVRDGLSTIGADTDSSGTFVRYNATKNLAFTLYPFNFGGDLGDVFYTRDAAQIYYIEGEPSSIPQLPPSEREINRDVVIRTKSLAGIDVKYTLLPGLDLMAGVGSARYLYPADDDFDIATTRTAESWEAKTDVGYKIGVDYKSDKVDVIFKAVTHEAAKEGGSLIETAANLRTTLRVSRLVLSAEAAYSKSGESPYNIEFEEEWLADFERANFVYTDQNGELEDWFGEDGYAYNLTLAYAAPSVSPFVSVSSLTEHYVYWEDESVHKLRTADRTKSHGGLKVYGLGVDFKRGNYTITPLYEYLVAKNEVFGNKTDLRENETLVNRNNKSSRIWLNLSYGL